MKDMLQQFLSDYDEGKITDTTLQRRLDFDMWKKDKLLLPVDYMNMPLEPSEIVEEKERQGKLLRAMAVLRSRLSASDWKIVVMVSQGQSQEAIGKAMEMTQGNVSKRLKAIASRAKTINLEELLRRPVKLQYARQPQVKLTYPVDYERKKKPCGIRKYLKDCGCESACTLCARRCKC